MKILTIIGARPQFIKTAVVSRAFAKHPDIDEVIVHTGQHFDENMSDIFFDELDIPRPQYNLNINSLSHGAMTGRMLEQIEKILIQEKADILLVYGDTNSTLAGAIAASKMHIPVAHVEAGLRSFNMQMPEEVNRILTDRVSKWLFCPTDSAVQNLEQEGYKNFTAQIIKTGDVMYDASLFYKQKIAQNDNSNKPFILATIHRQENTDNLDRLTSIVNALNKASETTKIILPLHPRTKKILEQNNLKLNAEIIDPVGYLEMVKLLNDCSLVVTDSGGLQKEAFFFDKYCLTMRDETEWTELVENGFNQLVGANEGKILAGIDAWLGKKIENKSNLYGAGDAGEKIVEALIKENE